MLQKYSKTMQWWGFQPWSLGREEKLPQLCYHYYLVKCRLYIFITCLELNAKDIGNDLAVPHQREECPPSATSA